MGARTLELDDILLDLNSTLIAKRLKAIKQLAEIKNPVSIEPLLRLLKDRSSDVRCAVVDSIKAHRPDNFPKMMRLVMQDESADVRLRLAAALGDYPEELSVMTLMTLLHDSKNQVADMAARSLAKFPQASLSLLIKEFASPVWKVRSRAATAVKHMKNKAVEALTVAITDKNPDVRYWALLCLGALKDKKHLPIVVPALKDQDHGVRIAALRALREIGDPSVCPQLFEALLQPSEQIRELVFEILKDFGTHSIPYLVDSLSSEYRTSRALAAQALCDMGSEAVYPLVEALESADKERKFWSIRILGELKEKTALPRIKELMSDPDSEIRLAATEAVAAYRNSSVIPLLLEKFIDPVWVVRKKACEGVVSFTSEAVPYLLKALKSDEQDIKYWSLRAIGGLRPAGVFKHILSLFRDPAWPIRKTASDVISQYGEAVLNDITPLAGERNDPEVRYWVLRSLGRIGAKESLPILFASLDDPSEAIRDAAQKALASYGRTICDDLFALFKSGKRRVLVGVSKVFSLMQPDMIVPILCYKLGHLDENVNYWIRETLLSFPAQAPEHLLPLLEHAYAEVRRQTIMTLGSLGRPEDGKKIAEYVRDESWPVRIAVAEALGKLRYKPAMKDLMIMAEDGNEELAAAAVTAIGKIGEQEAIPVLISALQRESWLLRYNAVKILGELRAARAFPDLLKLLDEDTMELKANIIASIAMTGHEKAFKELLKRFDKETEADMRLVYIDAFAVLQNQAAVPRLLKLAEQKESRDERCHALRAIGKLKAVEGKQVLIKALRDKEPAVAKAAMDALEVMMDKEEFLKTEKAVNAARKKQEEFAEAFEAGMQEMRRGNTDEAEKYFKKALKMNPGASYIYSAMGNMYYKQGKLVDATKSYQMAVKTSPEDVTLLMNLGMVYYRRRAIKEAIEIFEQVKDKTLPSSQQHIYAEKLLGRMSNMT